MNTSFERTILDSGFTFKIVPHYIYELSNSQGTHVFSGDQGEVVIFLKGYNLLRPKVETTSLTQELENREHELMAEMDNVQDWQERLADAYHTQDAIVKEIKSEILSQDKG